MLGYEEMFELMSNCGAKEEKGSFDMGKEHKRFASDKIGWVKNHYRWIVWKLASMERAYPRECALQMLTPERVLSQLKYRYERDVNRAHRSIIKKALEKDDSPGRHMVLLVADVKHDGGSQPSGRFSGPFAVVEMTDGWYSVPAVFDALLTRCLQQGFSQPSYHLTFRQNFCRTKVTRVRCEGRR